jgi:hypothetical protein
MFTDDQLAAALAGARYPAHRWELVTWADLNCAPDQLREALRHLPDECYRDRDELRDTFAGVEYRARRSGLHNDPACGRQGQEVAAVA